MKGSELPTRGHCRWQGYKAPSSALSTVKTKDFPPSSKSVSKDSLRMLCPDGLQSPELQTLQSGHPKGTRDKELFGPPTAACRSALSRAQGKDILLLSLSCSILCSILSDSLRPHGQQHARIPCPSLSAGVCLNP